MCDVTRPTVTAGFVFTFIRRTGQSLAAAQQWGIVQPVQLTVDFCITAVVRTGMCRVEAVLW